MLRSCFGVLLPALLTVAMVTAVAAEEPAPTVVTPDQPIYVSRLVAEQIDLALAASPNARAEKLALAAHQRALELRAVLAARKPDFAPALAEAYTRTLTEGIDPLLVTAEQQGLEMTASLSATEKVLRRHPALLDELLLQAPPAQEAVMQKAVDASRQVLGKVRAALIKARKQRGDLGAAAQEDDPNTEASAGTGSDGIGFDLSEMKKGPKSDESDDDRRKGRGK